MRRGDDATLLAAQRSRGLVFIIYGRARIAASPRDRGHGGAERKIHERNFYRRADILTLLSAARARSRPSETYRSVWALFYDGKPSNADRFARKRLFVPFRSCVRAVVPFAAVITTPNGSTAVCRPYGSRYATCHRRVDDDAISFLSNETR